MQLFYNPSLSSGDTSLQFDKEESKHIVKVLRKVIGDKILIANGKGTHFEAEITIATPSLCQVEITAETTQDKRPFEVHIAVAPTKMMERLEWFVEKATEIGIDSITPIWCERSERKNLKEERLEKIVQSAFKQSAQFHIPTVHTGLRFSELIAQNKWDEKFIAHCLPDEKRELFNELPKGKNTLILIGPEGDFTPKEIELALSNQYKPVSLGATRLRTETAALVALHTAVLKNLT